MVSADLQTYKVKQVFLLLLDHLLNCASFHTSGTANCYISVNIIIQQQIY